MNNFEINSNQKINLLPEHLINQIKAGEVIERPSTLLKELLENAIDAKATKIEIYIANYGLDLIQVKDNGIGIEFDQLPLAFCRHATSKIERFEDLYDLYSYGFRGEALASMASVSKLTCSSVSKQLVESTIKIDGGETTGHYHEKSTVNESGTNIYVKDLFYNTPARLKFVKSSISEKNQLSKVINAFLLTNPKVEFVIKWDEKDKTRFKIANSLEDRIKDIVFKKNIPNETLVQVKNQYDGIDFNLFYTNSSSKGHNGKKHFIFINNRLVFDKQIHQIILHCLSSNWPNGENGHYCAYINLPANQIDINVHPNKTIVKFHQSPKVLSLVSSSIKSHCVNSIQKGTEQIVSNKTIQTTFVEKEEQSNNFTYQSIFTRNDEQTLTNYQESQSSIIIELERFLIATHSNESLNYYVIDKNHLIKSFLNNALIEQKFDLTPIPLLISRPINFKDKISDDLINEFDSIGIEVEKISNESLVIRSIPQFLSVFTNDSLVEQIVLSRLSGKKLINVVDDLDISTVRFTSLEIEKVLHSLPDFITSCKKLDDALLETLKL